MRLRLKLAVQKSGRLTDPSLDLLTRCGLKLSRGKDQLMGVRREHAARRPVRARRRHPRSGAGGCVRSWAGRTQRAGGKAPGTGLAAGMPARFHAASARSTSGVAGCPWRFRMECLSKGRAHCGAGASRRLPVSCSPLPARARHHRRDRHSLRGGRDRPALRPSRSHLRPGLHRLDAAGKSLARSRDRARKPRGADSHAAGASRLRRTTGSSGC